MEAAPSAKPRRGSPPIPPNYVSLRQLRELRLKEKEEQEKRQREEEEAAAAAAEREAARKAEMEAIAAAGTKRNAARKPERRDGGLGPQWVAVAHRPAVPPRTPATIGIGRGSMGRADPPRGGSKPEGKAKGEGKEKVSAITSALTRAADGPGKPAEASSQSHRGKPETKVVRKAKGKGSGDTSAESGSIGGSGESAGASSRLRNNRKGKRTAIGRSAEASPDGTFAKTAGASPPADVKPEDAGKQKSPGRKRGGASPVGDSSHGKKADATPAPPTSAAAGVISDLCSIAETKPEGLAKEGRGRLPAVEVKSAAEQKPRVVTPRAWQRPVSDRCNRAGEQHGQVWVPKAAAGCGEL